MQIKTSEKKNSRNTKRYRPPLINRAPDYVVNVDCSECGRRACDVTALPSTPICIGLKCPHCQKIVHLQFADPQFNNTS